MDEKGVGNIKYGREMVWIFELKHGLESVRNNIKYG